MSCQLLLFYSPCKLTDSVHYLAILHNIVLTACDLNSFCTSILSLLSLNSKSLGGSSAIQSTRKIYNKRTFSGEGKGRDGRKGREAKGREGKGLVPQLWNRGCAPVYMILLTATTLHWHFFSTSMLPLSHRSRAFKFFGFKAVN